MKKFGPVPCRLVALLTGVTLACLPHVASAQGISDFMRPGTSTQGNAPRSNGSAATPQTSPAPNTVPQTMPQRSGAGLAQPMPAYNTYHHGPMVVLPEAPQPQTLSPGFRFRRREQYDSQGTYNTYNDPYASDSIRQGTVPIGPGNGFFNNSIPPIGPGNGFFNNLTPPVGPANGFPSTPNLRVTTPTSPEDIAPQSYRHDYFYTTTINTEPIIAGGPPLLGGFYYGNYCDTPFTTCTYPSVYSVYSGIPQYIFQPNVIVAGQVDTPQYVTSYQPFYPPTYQVNYNNNYYYFASPDRAQELETGGDQAQAALQNAYPASSYQAAFADIARAWTDGDIQPLRKHVRDSDTRISVSLNKKYSYSIASGDFVQITRDALDRLNTVSFQFTQLRKAKNGDVTAFGKHVYRLATAAGNGADPQAGDTVPFDQAAPDDVTNAPAPGDQKTVYVSYTLHHGSDRWYIIAIDPSATDLVSSEDK